MLVTERVWRGFTPLHLNELSAISGCGAATMAVPTGVLVALAVIGGAGVRYAAYHTLSQPYPGMVEVHTSLTQASRSTTTWPWLVTFLSSLDWTQSLKERIFSSWDYPRTAQMPSTRFDGLGYAIASLWLNRRLHLTRPPCCYGCTALLLGSWWWCY